MRIWEHRVIDDGPVPDGIRRQVLKRDRHCKGLRSNRRDRLLHVDHIVFRNKGDANTIDNLKSFFRCNGGKNNKDDTDFRDSGLPKTDEGSDEPGVAMFLPQPGAQVGNISP